jgi:hypothetical protein
MVDLWNKIDNLSEDESLVLLYETLVDNMYSIIWCDEFLKYTLTRDVTTDQAIHILNALSGVRRYLDYWSKFREYSYEILKDKYDTTTVKRMLKAITDE